MTPVSGRGLLGRVVRWNGIRVGAVVDLLLDMRGRRALGLEVLCEDGERRFLPLQAVELGAPPLEVTSPLALVDSSGLSFYRTRCTSLADLAGSPVQQQGRGHGALADVLVDPNGRIESLLVRDATGSRLVPSDEATVGAHARSA